MMDATDRALPHEFLDRLARILPSAAHEAAVATFAQPRPTTFRANTLKGTADDVQRAEWQARVRLDEEVFARRAPGASTESGSTGGRYLRFLLEGLGVRDEAPVEARAVIGGRHAVLLTLMQRTSPCW